MKDALHLPSPAHLAARVAALAAEAGFDRAGVTRAEPLGRLDYLHAWLAAGFAGRMNYLHRYLDQRDNPALLLDSARSVICLARDCRRDGGRDLPDELKTPPGYVARYARDADYHVVLKQMAFGLLKRLRQEVGSPFGAMVCVDSKPLLERELAARAGLGWIGKNGLLIHPQAGSHCLLAEIIVTLEIEPSAPMPDHCGRCRRCMDGCPTQAIVRPRELDGRRCISYLTIEFREPSIPEEFAEKTGGRLFGCDRCQDVCPFNRKSLNSPAKADDIPPDLPDRFDPAVVRNWTADDYSRQVAGTAGERATRSMWQRNAGE